MKPDDPDPSSNESGEASSEVGSGGPSLATLAASRTEFLIFCATAPALEPLLQQELLELGLEGRIVRGGVECRGGFDALETIHLRSRLAESVRVRVKSFVARDFKALVSGLERVPWHAFLGTAGSVHVSAVSHKSRLFHSDAVAERAMRVIQQGLKRELELGDRQSSDQRVYLRLTGDQLVVSVDATGERLHRRGSRKLVEKAPLRETLAAVLVRLLGPVTCIWDPFCGSGTLLLEWLEAHHQVTAGANRDFAFENWPSYRGRRALWVQAKEALRRQDQLRLTVPASVSDQEISPKAPTRLVFGSDISPKACETARRNLEARGFLASASLFQGDLLGVEARVPKGTALLSNPPYGKRLPVTDLHKTYQNLDQLLTSRPDLRPAVIITGYLPYLETTRHGWERVLETSVGGLRAVLLRLRR